MIDAEGLLDSTGVANEAEADELISPDIPPGPVVAVDEMVAEVVGACCPLIKYPEYGL
jgi:hypothetical protein